MQESDRLLGDWEEGRLGLISVGRSNSTKRQKRQNEEKDKKAKKTKLQKGKKDRGGKGAGSNLSQ